MSETANILGLPYEFTHHGKTVRLVGRDFEVEGYFSAWVEELGLKAIQRHRESLSVAEYDLLMTGWRRDCQAFLFEWDTVHCWRTALSEPGKKKLAALQIAKTECLTLRLAEEFVEEVWADEDGRKALEAVVEKANADPNRKRPWRKAAAG